MIGNVQTKGLPFHREKREPDRPYAYRRRIWHFSFSSINMPCGKCTFSSSTPRSSSFFDHVFDVRAVRQAREKEKKEDIIRLVCLYPGIISCVSLGVLLSVLRDVHDGRTI